MTDLRKSAERLLQALDDGWVQRDDWVAFALRQALAQPEQEPVAWMVKDVLDGLRYPSSLKNPRGSIKGESQPLYTAPPSKPWVGLSDAEVAIYGNQFNGIQLVKEIEGILKERNT